MSPRKNLLDVITMGRALPEGSDMWVIKTTYPDLRTRYDYRWPYPGNWATAPGPIDCGNLSPCPSENGDGICVAETWAGMASGGIPASTLLLCAISTSDILGRSAKPGKLRVARAYVVDLIDGERLIREHGHGTDLRYSNLRGMNLRGANLQDTYMRYTDLQGAILQDTNLRGAYMQVANLQDTNLQVSDLRGANLQDANLYYANLQDADLRGADLRGALLQGALLRGANLRGVVLSPKQRAYAQKQGARL